MGQMLPDLEEHVKLDTAPPSVCPVKGFRVSVLCDHDWKASL